MLEKAPQLEPQTLLLHLERSFPGQEWYRRKRTLQRRVEQWKALHGPSWPTDTSHPRESRDSQLWRVMRS